MKVLRFGEILDCSPFGVMTKPLVTLQKNFKGRREWEKEEKPQLGG